MRKRSGLHRILAVTVSIIWGTSELLALQRAYLLSRFAKIKSGLI